MSALAPILSVRDILTQPRLTGQGHAFVQRFAGRFDSFFGELDAAIAAARAAVTPLTTMLLETLPPQLAARLDALEPAQRGALAKEAVRRSLMRLPHRLETTGLPSSVLDQYPLVVSYTVQSLLDETDTAYGNRAESYFDRDLRMAEGLTLPAGAEVVDLRCALPPTFYRYMGWRENLRCARFVAMRLRGRSPLFRIHVDTRNLADFNEAGWNRCYLRIAELLEAMPEVRGMVGTSWFYDPALAGISPNLAYLRRVPVAAGAFLRIDGPGEVHTRWAIMKSTTRRRLFAEGRYLPTCATLVWDRRALLAWARSYRATT